MIIKRHKLLNPHFQSGLVKLVEIDLPLNVALALSELARACAFETDLWQTKSAEFKSGMAQDEIARQAEVYLGIDIPVSLLASIKVSKTCPSLKNFSAKEVMALSGLVEFVD